MKRCAKELRKQLSKLKINAQCRAITYSNIFQSRKARLKTHPIYYLNSQINRWFLQSALAFRTYSNWGIRRHPRKWNSLVCSKKMKKAKTPLMKSVQLVEAKHSTNRRKILKSNHSWRVQSIASNICFGENFKCQYKTRFWRIRDRKLAMPTNWGKYSKWVPKSELQNWAISRRSHSSDLWQKFRHKTQLTLKWVYNYPYQQGKRISIGNECSKWRVK